jgi:Ca2+/Na+ antiporter
MHLARLTSEEIFIAIVARVNRLLILLGIFFFIYFLLNTKVNIYLLLLSLLNLAFSLLSYKHLLITTRLAAELEHAKMALEDVSKETREMHQG